MRRMLILLLSWCVLAGTSVRAGTFEEEIRSILEANCTYCHGMPEDDPEGDFSLARFDSRHSALQARQDWEKVLRVVEDYQMPPADDDTLDTDERRMLVDWIRGLLAEPEFGERRNPGRPVLRRLTRLEYNNVVRDLLGLETDVFMFSERLPFEKDYFQPASETMPTSLSIRAREYGAKYPVLLPGAGLPADSRAEHGFSNRGDAQDLSPTRLEQYVRLAEQIAFHPELLNRARRMEEIFPDARFERLVSDKPAKTTQRQIVNAVADLAPRENVTDTADGSAYTLDEYRAAVAAAFAEDRGGVYDVSQQANTTVAGKGGVLQLAFGVNADRLVNLNPSEDIWNVGFATAEASSGGAIFTNKRKQQKRFFFGVEKENLDPEHGIQSVGLVVLSRRGQSGTVRVTAEWTGGQTKTLEAHLSEGAGANNTFVSFQAPKDRVLRRLTLDGSDFSGPYALFDDLAFICRGVPGARPAFVGRETPDPVSHAATNRQTSQRAVTLDRSLAERSPRERLTHFMRRAFRRPVGAEETDLYLRLYESEIAKGNDDETAMRRAIQGVLASPSFLYVVESGRADDAAPGAGKRTATVPRSETQPIKSLTDYELAFRLSLFLWSSLPDAELTELAEQGRLHDAATLEAQTRRMMKDPRVRELSENFFVEWLRLRELWSAQPDRRKFRDYYAGPIGKRTLADDMFLEALLLFETILVEDRSILELVHSDYIWINEELAELYQLQAPSKDWQRVQLKDSVRGGVLTGAAVLTLTSYPHRTSLIRRGSWVLETIFNRPPPPPQIAVADIDEQDDTEQLTLREKVELHRQDAACAVCHDRIDPPGFALENYDAIGRYRTRDGDEAIDPSGTLRGLGEFNDAAEFKQLLLEDRTRVARAFTEHLLSYALSRKLDYYDAPTVDRIVQAAAEDDFRLSRIVVEIVKSYPFGNLFVGQPPLISAKAQ